MMHIPYSKHTSLRHSWLGTLIMMLVSVCFSFTFILRPLDLHAVVCARGAGVTGSLGDWPINFFSPLGPTLSFRALCTGALSISLQARFLLKWLYSRC